MQIIIESAVESGKIPEWGLLEFQGSFLTREKQPIHGEFIGDLNYTNDGLPFFIVGHHILYGEEVKLPRPIAVLNKETDEESNMKKYLVKAVIRRKVLFKQMTCGLWKEKYLRMVGITAEPAFNGEASSVHFPVHPESVMQTKAQQRQRLGRNEPNADFERGNHCKKSWKILFYIFCFMFALSSFFLNKHKFQRL